MEFPNFVQELVRATLIMQAVQKLETDKKNKCAFWQPWLQDDNTSSQKEEYYFEEDKYNKQTNKWKRDRRPRLPEYTRKFDPKIHETFGSSCNSGNTSDSSSNSDIISNSSSSPSSVESKANGAANESNGGTAKANGDSPLDMSVRHRGQPPSYAQTINNPNFKSSYRPQGAPPPHPLVAAVPNKEDLPSGFSMCDPIIDEHFRRSLGNDYHTVFANNNVPKEPLKETPPVRKESPVIVEENLKDLKDKESTTSVIELMESAGLSVDDHFAKALGDTWTKLNKKEAPPEIKTPNASENNLVSFYVVKKN